MCDGYFERLKCKVLSPILFDFLLIHFVNMTNFSRSGYIAHNNSEQVQLSSVKAQLSSD